MRPGYRVIFSELNDKNKSSRFSESLSSPIDVEPFFTVSLRNVSSVGSHGLLITSSGKLVWETHQKLLEDVFRRTLDELGLIRLLSEIFFSVLPISGKRKVVREAAYLFPRVVERPKGAGVNFGHWMLESLPQLRGVEHFQHHLRRKIPLFVNPQVNEWQKESLELMGFGANELIEKEETSIRFKRLLLSSTRNVHSQGMELDPLSRKWVRERLTSKIKNIEHLEESGNVTKMAMFRQNHPERKIQNYEEVENGLKSLGFSCKSGFEIATLNEELTYSRNVQILVAVFGSSIARILLMPNLSEVIEIHTQDQEFKDVYFWLCMELEISYSEIQVRDRSTDPDEKKLQTNATSDISPIFHGYLDPVEIWHRLSKF